MTITNDLAVFAGNSTISNTVTINYTGNVNSSLMITGTNIKGGVGYHDFLMARNGGAGVTNPNKSFRINSTGGLEIVNSSYNGIPFLLTDGGSLQLSGTLTTISRGISAASVPAGSVLQVAQTTWAAGSAYTAQSATNIDFTGFSATFTPLYSTSKVLIQLFAGVNGICDLNVYIKRNGTIIENSWFGSSRQDDVNDYPYVGAVLLDSPATTSTITYQIGGRATGCGNYIRFGGSDSGSRIVFMEIAG